MNHRLSHTASLHAEHRGKVPVKKLRHEHAEWYAAEYRQKRDPYKRELQRQNLRRLDRRFEAGLQGIPLNEELPDRGRTASGAPVPLAAPGRSRR